MNDTLKSSSINNVFTVLAHHGDEIVRLVAELRAWPHSTVKWYKGNNEMIPNDGKYWTTFENGVAELQIKKVMATDSGQYTVVATSSEGEVLLTADLIIQDALDGCDNNHGDTHLLPSILLQPLVDQTVRVGKKVRFTVAAWCPPEPLVRWYRNKEQVAETDKYQIARQGGVCSLDILMVEPSDNNTTWKCEVTMPFGYAVSTAQLHAIVPKGYHKPEFLEGLKALLTAQGTVSLECKVVGVPTPLLRWFKDGKEIKAGDMFNLGGLQSNEEGSSLGIYTCLAINCMGKAVSSAQVSVTEKPEEKFLKAKVSVEEPVPVFIEGLEDKTIKVGENHRLNVRVRTPPPPVQVSWYNNIGEMVEASEKFHLSQVDESIHCLDIIPLELNDDGPWRCVATNQYGQTTTSCHITLTIPKNYRSPEFVEDLVAIFTDDGLVSFECKVIGVPTPVLRWYKDGLELKPGDVHQLAGTNSLGSYSCVARNCMGFASSLAELTLEDIYGAKERRKMPAKHPPRFTQHLKDETVFIGENFNFTVSVTCPPIPEVTWYKDNVRHEETSRHHQKREKNSVYRLEIECLEMNDQGVWKCLAVNEYGHSLTQCTLRVVIPRHYKKPRFIENLRAVLSEEGTVSLECKVVGVPQPVLKWHKDGIELKAGDIYKIISGEGGTSCLGTYTCEARNCMGQASSTAALLAFDDKCVHDRLHKETYQQDLSTIEEKEEFSTYGTPSVTDNWDESRAEMEFSIYETPDITEDEARQIVEMFADEVSEYISTKEASELPPLRFTKESALVGNILMEAVIIDVPLEHYSQAEDMPWQPSLENLATEADVADISVIDPLIVDLPRDFSEAPSLHELLIDISASSGRGQVVIKETSTREVPAAAVVVDAPLILSSTTRDPRVAVQQQVHVDQAKAAQQMAPEEGSRKAAAVLQEEASDDTTVSDNLGTDADVESIASLEEEEELSDDPDGNNKECASAPTPVPPSPDLGSNDEDKIPNVLEGDDDDDVGRATPTYQFPPEAIIRQQTHTRTGPDMDQKPSTSAQHDRESEFQSKAIGNQPRMLTEIAGSVLQKAAEGIITTAVIAESIVAAAASMIISPEEKTEENMFTFGDDDLMQIQRQTEEQSDDVIVEQTHQSTTTDAPGQEVDVTADKLIEVSVDQEEIATGEPTRREETDREILPDAKPVSENTQEQLRQTPESPEPEIIQTAEIITDDVQHQAPAEPADQTFPSSRSSTDEFNAVPTDAADDTNIQFREESSPLEAPDHLETNQTTTNVSQEQEKLADIPTTEETASALTGKVTGTEQIQELDPVVFTSATTAHAVTEHSSSETPDAELAVDSNGVTTAEVADVNATEPIIEEVSDHKLLKNDHHLQHLQEVTETCVGERLATPERLITAVEAERHSHDPSKESEMDSRTTSQGIQESTIEVSQETHAQFNTTSTQAEENGDATSGKSASDKEQQSPSPTDALTEDERHRDVTTTSGISEATTDLKMSNDDDDEKQTLEKPADAQETMQTDKIQEQITDTHNIDDSGCLQQGSQDQTPDTTSGHDKETDATTSVTPDEKSQINFDAKTDQDEKTKTSQNQVTSAELTEVEKSQQVPTSSKATTIALDKLVEQLVATCFLKALESDIRHQLMSLQAKEECDETTASAPSKKAKKRSKKVQQKSLDKMPEALVTMMTFVESTIEKCLCEAMDVLRFVTTDMMNDECVQLTSSNVSQCQDKVRQKETQNQMQLSKENSISDEVAIMDNDTKNTALPEDHEIMEKSNQVSLQSQEKFEPQTTDEPARSVGIEISENQSTDLPKSLRIKVSDVEPPPPECHGNACSTGEQQTDINQVEATCKQACIKAATTSHPQVNHQIETFTTEEVETIEEGICSNNDIPEETHALCTETVAFHTANAHKVEVHEATVQCLIKAVPQTEEKVLPNHLQVNGASDKSSATEVPTGRGKSEESAADSKGRSKVEEQTSKPKTKKSALKKSKSCQEEFPSLVSKDDADKILADLEMAFTAGQDERPQKTENDAAAGLDLSLSNESEIPRSEGSKESRLLRRNSRKDKLRRQSSKKSDDNVSLKSQDSRDSSTGELTDDGEDFGSKPSELTTHTIKKATKTTSSGDLARIREIDEMNQDGERRRQSCPHVENRPDRKPDDDDVKHVPETAECELQHKEDFHVLTTEADTSPDSSNACGPATVTEVAPQEDNEEIKKNDDTSTEATDLEKPHDPSTAPDAPPSSSSSQATLQQNIQNLKAEHNQAEVTIINTETAVATQDDKPRVQEQDKGKKENPINEENSTRPEGQIFVSTDENEERGQKHCPEILPDNSPPEEGKIKQAKQELLKKKAGPRMSAAAIELETIKAELKSFKIEEVARGKMTIEELSSSYEDSSSSADRTPNNMLIESASDDTDKTLVPDDCDTLFDVDESIMEIEEIPLEDFALDDVIENVRALKRLQTILEVDEITEEENEEEHISVATLKPTCCWDDDAANKKSNRAHSLQPAEQLVVEQRRSSYGDANAKSNRKKDSPHFITKLQDLTIPVEYRMRLTCCVIGSPEPDVQWHKNGSEITPDMGYRQINDYGLCVLEIPRASHSDSGEYSCTASNIHGKEVTKGRLTVKGKAKPSLTEPIFTRSILNMRGYCGDSITMDCAVIGWPCPNVTWLKDNVPLLKSDKVKMSVTSGGTHRLVITETELLDTGIYKCVAQNPLGKDEITASVKICEDKTKYSSRFIRESLRKNSTRLSESVHGGEESPTFLAELQDKRGCLGSNVSLQCEISGRPRPDVVWFHNGIPVHYNGHILFRQQDHTYSLTILDSSYSDLGMYTCQASNCSGTAYTSACLFFGLQGETMEFGLAPIFITKPQSIHVGKDDQVVLTCKVEGKPQPKVTWLKGARDMSLSRRAYKDSKGDIHKLVIHRAMHIDDGEYVVEARNKLGKEVARCSVTVSTSRDGEEDWDYRRTTSALQQLRGYKAHATRKDLPGPIATQPRVTEIGRNWVTLVWSRPHDDGGSSIMAYRIESCELPGNTWEEVGLSPITICDVYNLKPDSEYLLRVSARNMTGWSTPVSVDKPFRIVRRPEMPHFTSIPPSCLQARLGSRQTLECLVAGRPTPLIQWYKDKQKVTLNEDGRYRIEFDGTTAKLTIVGVRNDDEGCYMCEAVSDGGRATTFTVLGIDERPPETEDQIPRGWRRHESAPMITMHLRDRATTVDHLVRLNCQIHAMPMPSVTWYKDAQVVTNSDHEQIIREKSFYGLEINRVRQEDAGEYEVVAENDHGRVSSKCRLTVNTHRHTPSTAPSFSNPLENASALEGNSCTLRCTTTPQPLLRVTWFHNGHRLVHDQKHRAKVMPDGTCVLIIVQVTTSDSGIYACVASNELGQDSTSAEVTVLPQDEATAGPKSGGYSKAPIFLTKPRSTAVLEDDSVELLCEVIGDPKPQVLWFRDGLKFDYQKDPEHFIRLDDGPLYRLEIPAVTIDDTGRYAVVARNCHGDTKATISLQVFAKGQGLEADQMAYRTRTKAGNVATRPEVLQMLKNVRCNDGEPATLECKIRAVPLPEIRWEKEGHVIRPSEDFRQKCDGSSGTYQLSIAQVFPEDEGQYTCVAYNDAGRASTSAHLTVLPATADRKRLLEEDHRHRHDGGGAATDTPSSLIKPIRKRIISEAPYRPKKRNAGPKFVTQPHSRVVDEGETVKFTCSLTGHPAPTVQWEKCGRQLRSDGRIQLSDNDDLHAIVIAEVTPHDAGTYTVTATNCIGKVYASVKLDVIAKKKGKPRSYVSTTSPYPNNVTTTRTGSWSTAAPRSGRMYTVTAFEGPRVIHKLLDSEARPGDRLVLTCDIRGNPRPTITWTLNDKIVCRRWNCRTKYDGHKATLEIACIEIKEGIVDVCCTADNAHGTAKTSAKLKITKGDSRSSSARAIPVPDVGLGETCATTECLQEQLPREKYTSEAHSPSRSTKTSMASDDFTFLPTEEQLVSRTTTEVELSNGSLSVPSSCSDGIPPTFVETLTDFAARDGECVSMNVEVDGTPPFEVIWVRNDEQVTNSGNFACVAHDCHRYALVISDVFPEDAGTYACEVYNKFGNADSSCKLIITEPNNNGEQTAATKPDIVKGFPDELQALENDSFTLEVVVSGKPKPTVTWAKDGQKLHTFLRITTDCDGDRHTCSFARIRLRDAGIYTVTASNIEGKVTARTAISVKKASSSPSSTTGNDHRFDKQIASLSHDQSRNGKSLMTSPAWENSYEEDRNANNVVSNRNDLSDVFLISGDNQSGMQMKGSPAQIIKGPHNTTVLEGQKVHLKVCFIGKPKPTVKWTKGGKLIECNERIKMETCEEMSCISIDDVHSDDSGKYIVVVENTHGSDCHFASVAVEGLPDPPASKPVVTHVSTSAVTLCWYGSSYDGGSVITGYIVEAARVDDDGGDTDPRRHWQTLISNCHSTSYVARSLEPGAEYVFRIRAQNVHGISEPTEESESVVLEDREPVLSPEEELHCDSPEFMPVTVEDGSHFFDSYEIKEELGKGRFGRVHRVIETKSQLEYAAKCIRCIKSKDKEKVKDEIDVMTRLRHPKLLKLIAAFEKPREMIIVLEYISGGELFERVVAEDFDLTERDCILFTRQICDGVRYMHEHFIMHLDLKPENILCLERDGHRIKLIDFGLAKIYDPEKPAMVMFGTPEFVAPEVINYEPICPASDMWSIGVICYVLLSGLSPFLGENDAQTFSNVTKAEYDFDDDAFDAVSQEAKDFISSLLIKKKEKRLSAQECLRHHWLAQHERTMSSVKLCTDKLKRFIVRRKWQKSGNAIRALGRMVTLSGLSSRHAPLYSYSSGFGSNFSDSSDCDTSSNTSYRLPAQGSQSISETDEDSLLAEPSSRSCLVERTVNSVNNQTKIIESKFEEVQDGE